MSPLDSYRRRKRLRRPSRRVGRILLAVGITAAVLACVLVGCSVWMGNARLRTFALLYLFGAAATLCIGELRKRMYQIKKRKYSRQTAAAS